MLCYDKPHLTVFLVLFVDFYNLKSSSILDADETDGEIGGPGLIFKMPQAIY
jgi:hypothetical protein